MSDLTRIKEEIQAKLAGDNTANALNFVDFLTSIGMTASYEGHPTFHYMDKWACLIVLAPKNDSSPNGMWFPCCYPNINIVESANFPVDDSLKEYARQNAKKCFECGGCETPKNRKSIFGTEMDGLCCNAFHFNNPAGNDLENAKKLMELLANLIKDGNA